MDGIYQFTIDGSYSPSTLPMERLAAYMAAFAKLLGEQDKVHFESVKPGSAVLVAAVDEPAQPKVLERTQRLFEGRASQEVVQAFTELDTLLRKDNAVGRLVGASGAVIIPFPGRDRPQPLAYGPFRQDGTLDGQLIRIGGKDDTVPVHLRDGDAVYTGLQTTPEIARKLALYYLGPTLRVRGTGTWFRTEEGAWRLQGFRIIDFEVLDDTGLVEMVHAIRQVPGSKWANVADPLSELLIQRRGEAH